MARLDDLEVFYGASTHAEAHIYARLPRPSAEPSLTLTGCVRGPECDYSRTLTCSTAIRDLGPGPVLLGRAAVPDPCFWSPELPALYRVVVELRRDRTILEATERQIGIRQFGPRGGSLFLGGRRWVPRGVIRRAESTDDLNAWREAAAVLVAPQPDDALCNEASRRGVFVFADLTGCEKNLLGELRRLARWAAVAAAIIGTCEFDAREILSAAGNIQLAQMFYAGQQVDPKDWAAMVVGVVASPEEFARQFARCGLPVIAVRRYDGDGSVADLRAQCDRLQRDLAPFVDCAGYLV